jgi:hypothetical protein
MNQRKSRVQLAISPNRKGPSGRIHVITDGKQQELAGDFLIRPDRLAGSRLAIP